MLFGGEDIILRNRSSTFSSPKFRAMSNYTVNENAPIFTTGISTDRYSAAVGRSIASLTGGIGRMACHLSQRPYANGILRMLDLTSLLRGQLVLRRCGLNLCSVLSPPPVHANIAQDRTGSVSIGCMSPVGYRDLLSLESFLIRSLDEGGLQDDNIRTERTCKPAHTPSTHHSPRGAANLSNSTSSINLS